MNLNDLFGPNANRPDTPEFWALSEIVLKLDGRMDESPDKDAVFDGAVAATGMEGKALAYMGMQRAFRALGITHLTQLKVPDSASPTQKLVASTNLAQVTKMAALYMEAFIVGSEYEKKRASR